MAGKVLLADFESSVDDELSSFMAGLKQRLRSSATMTTAETAPAAPAAVQPAAPAAGASQVPQAALSQAFDVAQQPQTMAPPPPQAAQPTAAAGAEADTAGSPIDPIFAELQGYRQQAEDQLRQLGEQARAQAQRLIAGDEQRVGAEQDYQRQLDEYNAANNQDIRLPGQQSTGSGAFEPVPIYGPLQDYAREAAKKAGVDPELFVKQIQQESGFNPNAVSPAGATGVAQIVPKYHPGVDPKDPYASLDYAARLMRSHLNSYQGDYTRALVAYNGGGGGVAAWDRGQPYDESKRYVQAILGGARPTASIDRVAPDRQRDMPAGPSLSHAEEPGTATDVNGKWKTQFDHGAIYTGPYRTGTPHRGIDLVPLKGGIGTPVEAFVPGTVTNIARDSGAGGLMVYVQDDQGLTHTYMHLAGTAPGLKVGQRVARGTPIAQMGESGTEGSPHLHYEVRKNAASGDPLNALIDPRPYMRGEGPGGSAPPAGGPSIINPTVPDRSRVTGEPPPRPIERDLPPTGEPPGASRVIGDTVAPRVVGDMELMSRPLFNASLTESEYGSPPAPAGRTVVEPERPAAPEPPAPPQTYGEPAREPGGGFFSPPGMTREMQPTPSDELTRPVPQAPYQPDLPVRRDVAQPNAELPAEQGPTVLPALDRARQAVQAGDSDAAMAALGEAREAVATSAVGPVLDLARGPELLRDEEVIARLSPTELELATNIAENMAARYGKARAEQADIARYGRALLVGGSAAASLDVPRGPAVAPTGVRLPDQGEPGGFLSPETMGDKTLTRPLEDLGGNLAAMLNNPTREGPVPQVTRAMQNAGRAAADKLGEVDISDVPVLGGLAQELKPTYLLSDEEVLERMTPGQKENARYIASQRRGEGVGTEPTDADIVRVGKLMLDAENIGLTSPAAAAGNIGARVAGRAGRALQPVLPGMPGALLEPVTRAEMFATGRYSSMLSGPRTAEVAVLGNLLSVAHRFVRDMGASALSREGSTALGEIIGIRMGGGEAASRTGQTLVHGVSEAAQARGDVPRSVASRMDNPIAKGAWSLIESPMRIMEGIDAGTMGMVERMSLGRQAGRQASSEGLQTGTEQWVKRVQDLIENPSPRMVEDATSVAERTAFKGEMGRMGKALEEVQKVPYLGPFVIPFLRTVYHSYMRGLDMTPVLGTGKLVIDAFVRGKYGNLLSPSNLREQLGASRGPGSGLAPLGERVGDQFIGTTMMLKALDLADDDLVTGMGPADPNQRDMLVAQGWQPYSVKIGDRYISYANTHVALPMAIAAAISESGKYRRDATQSELDRIGDMAARTGKVTTEQSMLRQVGDIIKAIEDPQRYGGQLLASQLQSSLPLGAGVSTVGQALDPMQRDIGKSSDDLPGYLARSIQSRIPGNPLIPNREQLPERLDQFGRPMLSEQSGIGALAPLRSSTERYDAAIDALLNSDVTMGDPPDSVKNVKLSPEQRRQWQQIAGQMLLEATSDYMKQRDYDPNNREVNQIVFRRFVDRMRNVAGNMVLDAMPQDEIERKLEENRARQAPVPAGLR